MTRVMESLKALADEAMIIRCVYEGQHHVFNAGIECPTPSGTSPKHLFSHYAKISTLIVNLSNGR